MKKRWTLGLVVLTLLAAPLAADDLEVAYSGADLWMTAGAGSTYTSFTDNPIPADFFCQGSPPFTGTIAMEGRPIVTEPPGVLGYIDTVVHRLDDAYFDADGVAVTRIRLMVLSLASSEPIDVGCERPHDVSLTLDGEQPTTEMTIYRLHENGGTYVAPLAINARVTFAPAGGGEPSTVSSRVRLGPGTNAVWSTTERVGVVQGKPVLVDTDGDRVADSVLPGPSNFLAGLKPVQAATSSATCLPNQCLTQVCHCDPNSIDPNEPNDDCTQEHMHCLWICLTCGPGCGEASSFTCREV